MEQAVGHHEQVDCDHNPDQRGSDEPRFICGQMLQDDFESRRGINLEQMLDVKIRNEETCIRRNGLGENTEHADNGYIEEQHRHAS